MLAARRLSRPLLVIALLLALPALTHAQSKAGQKLTDKLIKSANAALSEVAGARNQIETTLAGYNEIVDGKAADNRKAYNKLAKDIDKCDAARGRVRTRITDMQLAADALFKDWEGSLAGFSSEDLRERSAKRLEEARAGYDQILQAANRAGAEFDPFLTALRDQILFLGHDLNPSAISDLADDKTKLNDQAKKVFTTVDDAASTARQYVAKLSPQ